MTHEHQATDTIAKELVREWYLFSELKQLTDRDRASLEQRIVAVMHEAKEHHQHYPPTPAQIAARLVERWNRNTDLADAQWGEKLADLERHIEAAILAAERAREAT